MLLFTFSGLYNALPMQATLDIFQKYLSRQLFTKLSKYVKQDCDKVRNSLHWNTFQEQLD